MLERSLDEMTLPQYRILSLVAGSPERAGRIASKAAVSAPSLTGILEGLVKKGWVRRIDVDDDRRGVTLEITAFGRRALDRGTAAVNARLDVILANVDLHERQVALDGLAVLGHACSNCTSTAIGPRKRRLPGARPADERTHARRGPDRRPSRGRPKPAGGSGG